MPVLAHQAERELESEVIPHKSNSFISPVLASIRPRTELFRLFAGPEDKHG